MESAEWSFLPVIRALMRLKAAHQARGESVSLNKKNKLDGVLDELRDQGLQVTLCSALNETWYIKDDGGLFTGYIASGAELLELKSADKLNIRGIKSLG
jgi:hypothetical protein